VAVQRGVGILPQQRRGAVADHRDYPAFARSLLTIGSFRAGTKKGEFIMNWDQIEGNWKQIKGNIREKWGKLTDDDLEFIAGKRDQLVGKLQEKYGLKRDELEKQLDEFQKNL